MACSGWWRFPQCFCAGRAVTQASLVSPGGLTLRRMEPWSLSSGNCSLLALANAAFSSGVSELCSGSSSREQSAGCGQERSRRRGSVGGGTEWRGGAVGDKSFRKELGRDRRPCVHKLTAHRHTALPPSLGTEHTAWFGSTPPEQGGLGG